MSTPQTAAWDVSDLDFPSNGTVDEQLYFLTRYAILSPSGHNSQPWLFSIEDETLDLMADRRRALPVVDPCDRELTISCGAALFILRVALRRFGYAGEIEILPDDQLPDLVARIRPGGPHVTCREDHELFAAITSRHTNRSRFEDRAVLVEYVDHLRDAVSAHAAWLQVTTDNDVKRVLADLIAEGDRIQSADVRFRRELAAWLHANRAASGDGIPGYAMGIGDLESYVEPLVVRTFDWGSTQAARDEQLALGSPVLAVIGTDGDTPRDWLNSGEALAHLLLQATHDGLSASFLNQPIEVETLRSHVAEAIGKQGHPQLLLRLGYGPAVPPTPRRDLADVFPG